MALELVTGYRGRLHITAPQDADLYRGLIGDCIIKVGNQMSVEITSPTEVTISDGVCLFDGREFFIEYGDSVSAISTVESGEAYLCVCYERDEMNQYETADFQILESYDDKDIRERPDNSQKPFARLTVVNGEITAVEVLPEIVDPIKDTALSVEQALKDVQETLERVETDVANLEDLIAQTEQAVKEANAVTVYAEDCITRTNEAAERAETVAESLEEYEGRFASDESKIADLDRRVTALEEGTVADKIFAIYCADDGSLTFYADSKYPDGSTYKDKTITELYESIDIDSSGDRPWKTIGENIISASFDKSFAGIKLNSAYCMFESCTGLKNVDLSNFDTSAVTTMYQMFYNCSSLTSLDVSNFDTSAVTTMRSMFNRCSSLTSLDVSNFDTSAVTDIYQMFRGCSSLTSLDVSNFDTSAVTDMYCMFCECSGLTSLDVSKFDTSAVTDMGYMFYGCSGLTSLDVSKFDTSAVTTMYRMFFNCSKLKTIYSDDAKFVTTNVGISTNMFYSCTSLVGGNGTKFDSSKVDASMAHVDTSSNPGYFTKK